jgi:sporulation protein YlmC with PRC-barrel domain
MEHIAWERVSELIQEEALLTQLSKPGVVAAAERSAIVTSIIGDVIFNATGDVLGAVVDIMFDVSTGKIEFVIIARGGVFGFKQRYSKVPFPDLTIDRSTRHAFSLNETVGSLGGYAQFEKHQWRDVSPQATLARDTDYVDFMSGEG